MHRDTVQKSVNTARRQHCLRVSLPGNLAIKGLSLEPTVNTWKENHHKIPVMVNKNVLKVCLEDTESVEDVTQ